MVRLMSAHTILDSNVVLTQKWITADELAKGVVLTQSIVTEAVVMGGVELRTYT